MAIAHFTSHEEAEAWMKSVAEPPSPIRILIGDAYYQFWYTRAGVYACTSVFPVRRTHNERE